MEIKYQKTKTITCRPNGRSADYTSANFILGCTNKKENNYKAFCTYCYVARFGRQVLYVNTNTEEILEQCNLAVQAKPWPKVPNQVDDTYYFIDIACDTDINAHWSDYDWFKVFDYFKNHEKLAATFATKWVNNKLLDYEPQGKIRVRMSLMPQRIISLMEKGTSPLIKRIQFLEKLYQQGYSTHINLSPIILYKNWIEEYVEVFKIINDNVSDDFKQQCGLECIFLTHNKNLHDINVKNGLVEQEKYLWIPTIQDEKISQYGGNNVRYNTDIKPRAVKEFTDIVNEHLKIPIRYIF